MRLPFFWRALYARPALALEITNTVAVLRPLKPAVAALASMTPAPSLVDSDGNLVAPSRLRAFLDVNIPARYKKPFSLVVSLPKESKHSERLATQVIAVLLQLKLPPYVVTTDALEHIPPPKLSCLFFKTPHGAPLPWKSAALSLLLTGILSVLYWRHTFTPTRTSEHIPAPTQTRQPAKKASIDRSLYYQPILAALKMHYPACQLISLSATTAKTVADFVTSRPRALHAVCRAFSLATKAGWRASTPRYHPGRPPLYFSHISPAAPNLHSP